MKKRADGRYCKQITMGYESNGQRKIKTIYGKTKREVEKKEREIKLQIDAGIYVDELTVSEWADIWLSTYKSNVEYNTLRRYQDTIHNQINPLVGRYKLNELRPNILQSAINSLSPKYSQSTLKKFKITLNQICHSAYAAGKMMNNPCIGLVVPKDNSKPFVQNDIKFITEDILPDLCEFCKNYRHGSFIMTLLYTGMRRGEITALTWGDVDFANQCIYINKAVEFRNNQPRVKCPKSKSGVRIIPLLNILKPFLIRPHDALDTDVVFTNSLGNMHTAISLRRIMEYFNKDFQYFLAQRGKSYQNITMHQFRHTYATILYKAEVDIKTAQSYLGHSSISVTMDIYTHLDQRHKKINADKLNSYICA